MHTRRTFHRVVSALLLALVVSGCGGKPSKDEAPATGILDEADPTMGAIADTMPAASTADPAAEMAKLRDEMAPLAVRIAEEGYGIRLDYSNESVEQVEQVLGHIHDEYKRTGDDKGLDGVSLEFGAYIVAVIERNEGPGRWERDHPQMGKDALPYYWRDRVLFPQMWCAKRILDGPGENVWAKFQNIVLSQVAPQ